MPIINPKVQHHPNLVGGLNPSEKYETVGMIIPNIFNKSNDVK
jgi:hypothetical protein